MSFLDKLFDSRIKKNYLDGCDEIFDIVWKHDFCYLSNVNDENKVMYKLEILSIICGYLDLKPKEKGVRVGSTLGKDCINYGTVHAPKDFKDKFLPKCYDRQIHYYKYFKNNHADITSKKELLNLVNELCVINELNINDEKIEQIFKDIDTTLNKAEEFISKYKLN